MIFNKKFEDQNKAEKMAKILVVSTSRKTRGGITEVLKLYEQSAMWKDYHCRWIGTHRDGNSLRKILYMAKGSFLYLFFLPYYDIVHFHISLEKTVARKYPLFKIAKAFGKKTIIHLHCGSQIDDIWNNKYQYLFENCDCGIVLSECLKSIVERHIGQTDKLKVVFNPCPLITATTQYEKQNHILFSGTLHEEKGYKDLIMAFATIADKYPDWKVVLAGNGEEDQARSLAQELGISNQVVLLGWVKDEAKHKAFSEAKALCLPSYAEGFPMAVLDAWSYGLPVVATPVGGIPDVALDGINMLLFNPMDVDGLAKQLEIVMGDKELRDRLSIESVKMSKGMFNLKTITNSIAEIYNTVICAS